MPADAQGTRRIAVVGAGAAGALVAIRLLEQASGRTDRVEVLLIDPLVATRAGRGLAYSTADTRHRLNTPAGRMSARTDDPFDFVRWLVNRTGQPIGQGDFVPRTWFGDYLSDLVDHAVGDADQASLHKVAARVVGLRLGTTGVVLELDSGDAIAAEAAVLAIGSFPPICGWAPKPLRESPRFVADPWVPGVLSAVAKHDDLLLVGTGLTMVDMAVSLNRPDRTIHVVSRHGFLPHAHSSTPVTAVAPPNLAGLTSWSSLRRAILGHFNAQRRAGGDWRAVVDGLRPLIPAIWAALPSADRARFLIEGRRIWDVHRHRLPPSVAEKIARLRLSGRLVLYTGEVAQVDQQPHGLRVELSTGTSLAVGAVVNCTGGHEDVRVAGDRLVDDLLATGLGRPDTLGLGLDTAADGRVMRAVGGAEAALWTIGALRRGSLWETTAFPEIRVQASELAACVLSYLTPSPPPPRRRPETATAGN